MYVYIYKNTHVPMGTCMCVCHYKGFQLCYWSCCLGKSLLFEHMKSQRIKMASVWNNPKSASPDIVKFLSGGLSWGSISTCLNEQTNAQWQNCCSAAFSNLIHKSCSIHFTAYRFTNTVGWNVIISRLHIVQIHFILDCPFHHLRIKHFTDSYFYSDNLPFGAY